MKRALWLSTLTLTLGLLRSLAATDLVEATGVYTYIVPENVSLLEAKHSAVQKAKIQAMADAFGTKLSQNNNTVVTADNVSFASVLTSQAGGEWIETIDEPVFKISYTGGQTIVEAQIKGKIRAVKPEDVIDLKVCALRNGTEKRYASEEFMDQDDLYLWLVTSVDGYVAVFLQEINTDSVYCLLPYPLSDGKAMKICKDSATVLFSRAHEDNQSEIEQYQVTGNEGEIEINDIHILFSPNSFSKPSGKTSPGMPLALSGKDYNHWLAKLRLRDPRLQVVTKTLKIRTKQ